MTTKAFFWRNVRLLALIMLLSFFEKAALAGAAKAQRVDVLAKEISGGQRSPEVQVKRWGRIEIYASDTKTYLGCLNCDVNELDSLRNPNSLFSVRFKNEARRYRDRTDDYSMCSRLGVRPPVMEIIFGINSTAKYRGFASLNKTLKGSVCSYDLRSALGEVCDELEQVCSSL